MSEECCFFPCEKQCHGVGTVGSYLQRPFLFSHPNMLARNVPERREWEEGKSDPIPAGPSAQAWPGRGGGGEKIGIALDKRWSIMGNCPLKPLHSSAMWFWDNKGRFGGAWWEAAAGEYYPAIVTAPVALIWFRDQHCDACREGGWVTECVAFVIWKVLLRKLL